MPTADVPIKEEEEGEGEGELRASDRKERLQVLLKLFQLACAMVGSCTSAVLLST